MGPSGPVGMAGTKGLVGDSMQLCYCSSDIGAAAMDFSMEQETGRIEKGSNSNQEFNYDNTTFNSYYTWKRMWRILPESQKPLVKEDLGVYCTNCGTKRRKDTHKFCPNCGTKF